MNAARFLPCMSLSVRTRFPSNSSLELSKELPLHRYHPHASTPRADPVYTISILSTGRYHRTDTFRPRRFSRPRRFAPHGALQVYCTPLPIMGSTRFQISSSFSKRPTKVGPQSPSKSNRSSLLPVPAPHVSWQTSEDDLPAPAWSQRNKTELIPTVAPPFEAFPSYPAVPESPSPSMFPQSSMPPPGLPLSSFFSAPFFQI